MMNGRDVFPRPRLDAQLHAYFEDIFGRERFDEILISLSMPSLKTTLRVNTTKTTSEEVVKKLKELFTAEELSIYRPDVDKVVSGVVTLHGEGPVDLGFSCEQIQKEVLISRKTGEAVLRGADVFAPGVLAATSGLEAEDIVHVSIHIASRVITRGTVLTDQTPDSAKLWIGTGTCQMPRTILFRETKGLAIKMSTSLFKSPPCNGGFCKGKAFLGEVSAVGVLQGEVMLQNLPSIVAAQVVDPKPGWRVLDMCAAPGGKTTAMAEWMQDKGEIIALDRTNKKAGAILSLTEELNLTCITAYKMDATKALRSASDKEKDLHTVPHPSELARAERKAATRQRCKQEAQVNPPSVSKSEGFLAESFDAVLLDAPCSALGLRPRLHFPHTVHELEETAQYQRKLLSTAMRLVKQGGVLVYSTCTINPGENEENVRYVLDHFPAFRLKRQTPHIANRGLVDDRWLTEDEASLVQRFYPDGDLDTIGFFIAKFERNGPMD